MHQEELATLCSVASFPALFNIGGLSTTNMRSSLLTVATFAVNTLSAAAAFTNAVITAANHRIFQLRWNVKSVLHSSKHHILLCQNKVKKSMNA